MKQSAGLSLCSRDDIRTHQKCVKVRTSIKEAIKERETKRINATERENQGRTWREAACFPNIFLLITIIN